MGKLEGKRVLILTEDLYQDLELWYPRLRLTEEGAEVTVAGPKKGEYRGKNGYPVFADISFDQVSPDRYDALVIPGGYAPDRLRRYNKVIDILRGKKATSFFAIRDDMINAGVEFVDAPVVVDGNLISSRKPDDLPEFCKAIIESLK